MSNLGRMVKWSVKLNEYSLEFRPRRAIKAQVLADFVVECSFQEQLNSSSYTKKAIVIYNPTIAQSKIDHWSIYVDGSSAREGEGVGVLLIGPNHQKLQYSLRFMFPITNNVAKYEALLEGLRLVDKIKAEHVTIYVDSQLVTRQVSGEYEVRDPSLKKYHELVEQIWVCFKSTRIIQIPRENNCRADELSRLDPFDSTKTVSSFVEYMNQPSIVMESVILTIDPTDW